MAGIEPLLVSAMPRFVQNAEKAIGKASRMNRVVIRQSPGPMELQKGVW